jgi:hypothetical protein
MWYEIEMFPEYIKSCIQMLDTIENPENVAFHFCFNLQEHLEKYDRSLGYNIDYLSKILVETAAPLANIRKVKTKVEIKTSQSEFYNIAKYRRDLNYNYCEDVDFVLWGETDSLWPGDTFQVIENIQDTLGKETPKFVLSFASRINWDSSWDITRHPLFEGIKFQDTEDWVLNNEASEKSYMSLERMNEINCNGECIDVVELSEPKADGSCLVISSELIKSGVNIPHALLHCGEDESFLRMAKLVMGTNFRQYLIKNILRVHNRRHPKKRMYIKNEDNPRGFCDSRKGDWWKRLEDGSKFNLKNLRNQVKFKKIDEVI